ncbi:MAG: family oxidoreductase [Rhodocyclales bacterium]|nr:family oxidoreductase [Rhodocyclales bacterium]
MSQKIAIITGGSRGLGKSAALHLAQQGVDILFTYHSKHAEALAVVAEIKASGRQAAALQLDVSNVRSFGAFVMQVKQVLSQTWQRKDFDYLVNNAGTGVHAAFAETSEEQFDAMVNIHFKGVFFLTQKLLPLIADHGRILNVSTGLTRFALAGYSAYAATKGAIEVLSHYLAKELGPRGIAVNTLAPGAIETDFGGGAVRDNSALNTYIASQTALGRVGQPDDIGSMVAALLSEQSGWLNAQRVEASGGMFI